MTIQIVPIAEEHLEGFHAALDTVSRERKYLTFLQAPPPERVREFILDNIREDKVQLVALDGTKVIGWCDIMSPNRDTNRHVGSMGVGLLPGWRNRGIGRRLIQAAIDKAVAKGMTRIELTVREKNENAIALYKSLGFETEGLQRNSTRIDGVYENTYFMALLK